MPPRLRPKRLTVSKPQLRYPHRQEQQLRVVGLIQNLGRVLQYPHAQIRLATTGSFASFSDASVAAATKLRSLQDLQRSMGGIGPHGWAPEAKAGNNPPSGKAMPSPDAQGRFVSTDYARYIGRSAGSGQCVALVQAASPSIGPTRTWTCGAAVRGNTDLQPGTAIATFDSSARYANATDGSSHAAIYLGQNERGIQVMDQWAGSTAAVRTIPWSNLSGKAANTGSAFHVVHSA